MKSTLLVCFAIVVAVATILLAFAPYGFHLIASVEEWSVIDTFLRYGLHFLALPGNVLQGFVLRPLTFAPFAVAYWLGPTSFVPWQMLLALSLVLKAAAIASILFRLSRNAFIALVGAALSILYPADTMQMTLRALHQMWAIGLSMSGIALVLIALDRQSAVWRAVLALLATGMFLTGGLIYEAAYFLAPAPLLVLWANGEKMHKVLSLPSIIWMGGILAAAAFLIIVSRSPAIYQQNVTSDIGRTGATLAGNLPKLFTIGFYRLFLHGWYDGFRMLLASLPATWPWAVGAVLAFAAAARTVRGPMPGRPLKWIAAGVALAALGYAPFLSADSHLAITQRTFNFAALGGTIAVSGLIYALVKRWPVAGKVVAGALLLAGLGGQWAQIDHYTTLSFRQRSILADLLEANPAPPRDKTILIIDKSGSLNNEWMLKGGLLTAALTDLYGEAVTTKTCAEPGMIWAAFVFDSSGLQGRCVETEDAWELGKGLRGASTIAKWATQTVIIEPDLSVHVPGSIVAAPTAKQRQRWASILGCATDNGGCRYHPPASDRFRYEFGDWWSLEQAPRGAGWTSASWDPPAWQPISAAQVMSNTAQLWFELQPRDRPYRLAIRFLTSPPEMEDAVTPGMTAQVNGIAVPLMFDGSLARGDIPPGAVREGLNEVTMGVPFDPVRLPFVFVDWVDVAPM